LVRRVRSLIDLVPFLGRRMRRRVTYTQDSDPQPAGSLTEDELHILASLIGREIKGVWYEVEGVVESAYLDLGDSLVELAGVTWADYDAPVWPWRISAVQVLEPLALPLLKARPQVTASSSLGSVESADVYSFAGAEVAIAFRLRSGSTLWAGCGGEDFIDTALDSRPESLPSGLRDTPSRSL
jgi:hypothetical protein